MESFWQGLTLLNKMFACAAVFFTVLFLWQIISLLVGMDADGHGDASVDHNGLSGEHHGPDLGGEITFTLVTVRSVIAFGMLFSWAGTLYLMGGVSTLPALIYSVVWGLAAMFLVSYLVYKLFQLQEEGNATVWSALGEEGMVYMNVPQEGVGKVRVMVSGAISYVNAVSKGGKALEAGARVRVTGIVDDNTIEVETIDDKKGE